MPPANANIGALSTQLPSYPAAFRHNSFKPMPHGISSNLPQVAGNVMNMSQAPQYAMVSVYHTVLNLTFIVKQNLAGGPNIHKPRICSTYSPILYFREFLAAAILQRPLLH